MRARAVWQLVRPFTLLAPAVGVASGAGIAAAGLGVSIPTGTVGVAVLAAVLATAASNAWNQVFDLEIDRVNMPGRPLPAGTLAPGYAMVAGDVFALGGAVGSVLVSPAFLACVVAGLLATWAYSAPPLRLKRHPLGALLAIAGPRGVLVPVAGWSVVASPVASDPWVLGVVSGLYVLGAAAAKDFRDVAGDGVGGCRTLPILLGPRAAARVVAPFFVLPFLLYPAFSAAGWLMPPVGRFAVLAAALALLGGFTARALLASVEADASPRSTTRVWRGMYLLLLASQVGTLLVYAL